ncbi:hypothetical protein DFH09DRAFT_1090141 [Mycena vulgaris]|nr:hypothetical protein DFH09DRAFT_1090141 [Mycena vulgaris]
MFSRARKVTISGGTFTIKSQVGDPTLPTRVAYWERHVARLEARLEELEASVDLRNLYVTYVETRWTTVGAETVIPTKVSAVILYKLVVTHEHTEEGHEPMDGCDSCGDQCPCGFSTLPPAAGAQLRAQRGEPDEAHPCSCLSCVDHLRGFASGHSDSMNPLVHEEVYHAVGSVDYIGSKNAIGPSSKLNSNPPSSLQQSLILTKTI